MKTVLITAFEPFGGERINPSWEAVKQLEGRIIAGATVRARQLPCVFGLALMRLQAAMEETQPAVVIAVGQAGGRVDMTVERVAINVDDARIPDNQGNQPVDTPVVPGGPAAWFSTLPIKATVQALREAGIPASVSQSAGTYVCNHVMYGLLQAQAAGGGMVKGGFIHIPWLPEQAVHHPGAASMALQTVVEGLTIAIRVALSVETDLRHSGGATH
ncbi:pyroglutamyl-peptidase I [Pantoea sp. 1.19]|uniref:pyroglutamyl-peptidase I n=1 Tax=Pantoea sp. 1.19 TaxID=1925589 RepID=UPI000948E8F1|nr:pyroglutamyl-peptidase I [Pantoea sp. 1.19]